MKKFLLLIFILNCYTCLSQKKWDTKEEVYNNGVVLTGIVDVQQSKVLGLKATGKEVTLKYDPYFDKYTIDWIEDDGSARMILSFKEQNEGGKMYIDTYASNTAYFVHNNIEAENKLTIISAEPQYLENKKVKLIMIFDDLK